MVKKNFRKLSAAEIVKTVENQDFHISKTMGFFSLLSSVVTDKYSLPTPCSSHSLTHLRSWLAFLVTPIKEQWKGNNAGIWCCKQQIQLKHLFNLGADNPPK